MFVVHTYQRREYHRSTIRPMVFVRVSVLHWKATPPDDIYKGDPVGILMHISNLQNVELTRKGGSHDWSWSDQR